MKLRIRPNAILGLGALLHIFFPLIIFLFLLYHFFILYFLKMINIIMYMYDQNIKSESKQTKLHQCFPIVKLTCYFTRSLKNMRNNRKLFIAPPILLWLSFLSFLHIMHPLPYKCAKIPKRAILFLLTILLNEWMSSKTKLQVPIINYIIEYNCNETYCNK